MRAGEGFEEFVAIVEAGSLTAAAGQLGLPRPTLSRRLARLEEELGVRLLHRSARRLVLTDPGQALYGRARPLVVAAREAEQAVRRLDGVPRGLLRVSLPMGLPNVAAGWFCDFLERYPEVRLETVSTAEHVDLVEEGFDAALRAGPIEETSLVARTLTVSPLVAVASPAYLAARGMPASVEDLTDHDCLVGFRSGRAPDPSWPLRDGGAIDVSGTWASNDMSVRFEAARRGRGIALVAERLAAPSLAAAELVHVLPGVVGRDERISVVYPDRRFLNPKVRAFVDLLVAYFSGAEPSAMPEVRG